MFRNIFLTILLLLFSFCGELSALEKTVNISVDSALEALVKGTEIGSVVAGGNSNKNSPTGISKLIAYFSSSTSSSLKINTEKDIIALYSGKNAILLAHTFGDQEEVSLGPESTAISLVLFSPTLLGLSAEQQQAIVPLIKKQPCLPSLVERIKNNIATDPDSPLDYFIHPFLGEKVNQLVKELVNTPEFSSVTTPLKTEQYKLDRMQAMAAAEQEGFRVSCKDADGNVIPNCTEAAKLSIVNPKSVYYGAYIDENKGDILDAKDALIDIEFGLYPPKLELSSSKETEFSFNEFGNGEDSYNINLTREPGWNPSTPAGSATWMNAIKGLSLMVELAGLTPKNDSSKISTWIKNNSSKLKKISDAVNKGEVRLAVIGVKAITEILRQIYVILPSGSEHKDNIGEIYYGFKKLSLIADQLINLLKLSVSQDEIIAKIDYYIEYFFSYQNTQELLTAVSSGNNTALIYQKIKTDIAITVRKTTSVFIMSSDVPFDYDFVLQKISAFYTQLETESILNSLFETLLNDAVDDAVKAVGNVILKNMFGLPYKIAVTGNKLVPYTWDMFMAPATLKFPVHQGQIKALPEPEVISFNIKNAQSETIYSFSSSGTNSQDFVRINPGEPVTVSYTVKMPGNFERGIEATDGWWTWLADYPEVSNFKATLAGRFEKTPWSKNYTRKILLEKELEVYTQRNWGIRSNAWNLNWYYQGQYHTLELDKNPDNWTSTDQVAFTLDILNESNTQLNFNTLDDIPDQLILNYNNFNYETTGSFLINVRKPNQKPLIKNISSHPKQDNNKIYFFDKIELSDDYTRQEELRLEIDYGDGTVEIKQGGELLSFSHEYNADQEYQVTFRAIDDENSYSDTWYENVSPGMAYPDAELSSGFIDFGDLEIGKHSSRSITIKNSGAAALEIGEFSITNQDFQLDAADCENISLDPGESASFSISFLPQAAKTYSSEITIPTNETSDLLVRITGIGVRDQNIPTSYARIFKPYQVADINGNVRTVSTYTPSGSIYGNVKLESGTLDLQGQTLIIHGHLIHSGGILKVNEGTLIVKGNYLIQKPTVQGYTYSSGILSMKNDSDHVLVEGNFVMDSYLSHNNNLTAGSLEIKGDFTQKSTESGTGSRYNFCAYTTDSKHKVVLSGSGKQAVSFENPSTSGFNIWEITNNSAEGLDFITPISIKSLADNATVQGNLRLQSSDIDLQGKILTINGDFTYIGNNLDINFGKLIVNGDFIHSGGLLKLNGGSLIVKGDYLIQKPTAQGYTYSSGILSMKNESDHVLVEGNFVMDSYLSHNNNLTAGSLEIKGDFTQKSTESGTGSRYNFCAYTTDSKHKVVLSGSGKQVIRFEDPNASGFNIWEVTNNSAEGLDFATALSIKSLANDTTVNGNLKLQYSDINLQGKNLTVNGDLTYSGNTLDLNSGKLTVNGNLIHAGGILKLNKGSLIVKKDYLIQKPTAQGYTYSSGILSMKNESDHVLVEGNFVMDSYQSHQNYLIAGIVEVKGNFTQKSTESGNASRYNFFTHTSHKMLLSGSAKQVISFGDMGTSGFNILKLTNTSEKGVVFETGVVIFKLFDHRLNNFQFNASFQTPDYDKDTYKDDIDAYPLNPLKWIREYNIAGDVNNDGAVDLTDTFIILEILTGTATSEPVNESADANNNQKIDLPESIYILQRQSHEPE
jgi:hypothetical protein